MKMIVAFFLIVMSTSGSCSIKGEQICGSWLIEFENGEMQIDITPWKGKFYGYLIKYQDQNESIIGSKKEEFMVLSDLEFKDNDQYSKGIFYLDEDMRQTCKVSFKMNGTHHMIASYECDDLKYDEHWTRVGFEKSKTIVNNDQELTNEKLALTTKEENTFGETTPQPTTIKSVVQNSHSKSQKTTNDTQQKDAFNIIGIQRIVTYADHNVVEKVMNELWESLYSNDFSQELKDITEPMNVYMVYSDYDNPKGKMKMTLGYKVGNLNNVPNGLRGIHISTDSYYTSPISGNASHYYGEEWKQIEELMQYRKESSVDFEGYSFDKNYEITKASIWISAN